MGIFNNIQLKLGRLTLKRKLKQRKRTVKSFSLEKASSIGVLYDATNRNNYEAVKKFIQYLKEERKDVLSLGFINLKDSSEIVRPHLNFNFFDKKNLSKSLIPKSNEVSNFIQQPYSILIDLSIEESFPLEYICSLSNAKFKVGAKGSYRDKACDMLIDVDSDPRIEYLIIQIKHYLKMIQN